MTLYRYRVFQVLWDSRNHYLYQLKLGKLNHAKPIWNKIIQTKYIDILSIFRLEGRYFRGHF